MMPVLVVIPCLNEEAYIAGLVTHLINSNKQVPLHIVIADGGSTDQTLPIIHQLCKTFEQVTYLHNPARLQGAGINLAVKTYGLQAHYFVRIDAHAHYPDAYIETLLNEAETHQASSVVVSMDTQGETPFQRAVAAAQNSKLGNGGASHRNTCSEGQWVDHGHHALMKISAFNEVGGYDESFSHNEDAELDIRLGLAGHRIWLTAITSIIYFPRATPAALFTQYKHYGRGRLRTMLKHHTRPKLRQLLPVTVLPTCLVLVFTPLCGLLALPFVTWSLLCTIYGYAIARKQHNPELIACGTAAMIMHFAWSLGFWRGLFTHIWAKKS